jgi:hypothetical protein
MRKVLRVGYWDDLGSLDFQAFYTNQEDRPEDGECLR